MNLLSLLHRLWYNGFKWTGGYEGSPSPAFPMFRLTQYHRSVFTMRKKQCVAMLLAGGQGSRLGILTKDVAKPAVPYGGKYRIIDFPLSNCTNSGTTSSAC